MKKNRAFIVVVVIAALALALSAGCSAKAKSVSGGSAGSGSQASASQDFSNMSVGQTVNLSNGLSVTVNEVEVFTQEYVNKPATRVNVTYVNNGDKKASFNMFDWKAEDANGAETGPTIAAGAENELNSGDLREGGTASGNIYFDGDNVKKVRYYSSMFQNDSEICWVLG